MQVRRNRRIEGYHSPGNNKALSARDRGGGLSRAIERGTLAGFLKICDPSPVLGESEEAQRRRRPALLQAALLEYAAAYNLRYGHDLPPEGGRGRRVRGNAAPEGG